MLLIEAAMANPAGESSGEFLRFDFNRRLMVQFRGSVVTSDAELFAHRDDALGYTVFDAALYINLKQGDTVLWRINTSRDGSSGTRRTACCNNTFPATRRWKRWISAH
jgi:hypothetical protein